jgi:hypothetical protein
VIVAARTNPKLRRAGLAGVLAGVLLAAGCTSGGGSGSGGPSSEPTTGSPATAQPLQVQLVTVAKVPPGGPNARRAARQAAPGLERFLDRYLTAAFVDAAGGDGGWNRLLAMFDTPVRAAARKKLDALSLGAAAPTVTAVQPGRASANAAVLYASQPVAATVRVAFDGTATTAKGSGQVHLRSVLQLLWTRGGWRIAAFDSRTGPPA